MASCREIVGTYVKNLFFRVHVQCTDIIKKGKKEAIAVRTYVINYILNNKIYIKTENNLPFKISRRIYYGSNSGGWWCAGKRATFNRRFTLSCVCALHVCVHISAF